MALSLASAAPALATTYNTDCANLQMTMDGTASGDTVVLNAGSVCFNGNSGSSFNLPNHAITLKGGGSGATFDGAAGGPSGSPILTGSDVGSTVINNLTFQNSNTSNVGSAIDITGNSSPVLDTLRFIGNSTNEFRGGAVYITTNSNATGAITVNNSTFGTSAPGSGNTTVSSGDSALGGALYIDTPKPVIVTNNSFTGNSGSEGGAFWYSEEGPPNLTVTNNTFVNNRSVNGDGGGFGNSNNNNSGTGTLTFSGNSFTGNQTTGEGGGADISTGCSQIDNILMTGNGFSGNRAQSRGGGLAILSCNGDNNTWTLNGNTFSANQVNEQGSDDAKGGGVYMLGNDDITLNQNGNVFDSNAITSSTSPSSGIVGGGGEWLIGMALSSTGDRFTNNALPKTAGGNPATGLGLGAVAGCTSAQATDPVTLTNDVVAGNNTPGPAEGAGVYVGPCLENVALSVLDSTIVGNTAASGAAVFGDAGDTFTTYNSIIRGGTGTSDVNGFAGLTAAASDVCQNGGPLVGPGNICADPKLVATGPGVINVHQTAASPTIDAGSNALVPAGLTTDFEGKPRIVAGHAGGAAVVDMGADEAPAGTVAAPPKSTPQPPAPVKPRVFVLGTFTFSNGTVKINRKTGVGFLIVVCHAAVGDVCKFTGSLFVNQVTTASAAAKKKAKSHRVRIGSVSGTVPGGKTGRLKVKLTKKGLALLKKSGGRLTVTYIGTMRHRGAGARHINRHIKLRLG